MSSIIEETPTAETLIRRLPKHLPVLDGIRGIAILMVMLSHLIDGAASSSRVVRVVTGLLHGGWAGVDLFFVLSGFLITGILLDTRDDPHYFRNFYARRTLRIFPLYYGVLIVVFGILPWISRFDTPGLRSLSHNQPWLWLYGTNIRLGWSGNWGVFDQDWIWLNHFWSLAVEEHFYLIWPTVVLLSARRRGVMAGVCIGCVLAVLIARMAAAIVGVNEVALYVLTPFRVDSLVLGGLAALLVRGPRGIRPLIRPAWGVFAVSGIGLVVLRILDHEMTADAGRSNYFTGLGLFFASGLVLAVAANPQAGGMQSAAAGLLAHPTLRFMGRYSYGLYVMESLFQPLYERLFSTRILSEKLGNFLVAGLVHLVLCLSATLLLAVISFHVYEKPFLKLKRFFDARRPAAET